MDWNGAIGKSQHAPGFPPWAHEAGIALWKVFLACATCAGVSLLYYPSSYFTIHRSYDLMTAFDRAIPFVPWTWWIYFPHYLAMLVISTVAIQDRRILHRTMLAILLAQFISSCLYFVVPSTFPRPEHVEGVGLTAGAMRWFWTVDPANNTFPSTHTAIAFLAAFGVRKDGSRIWWYSLAGAMGVFVTVHTAKQHYWIDAVAGVAVALLAFNIVFRLLPVAERPGVAQRAQR